MTLISLARIACLTSLLIILGASPSFSNTTNSKSRSAKQQVAKRVAPNTARNQASAPGKKTLNASQLRSDKRRQVAVTKPRVQTRPAKLSRSQLRLEQQRYEAKRLAERQAYVRAIANQRQRDDDLRSKVRAMIATDDLTGEDPEIRRIAINALGNHAGTVVVMNPQTGLVYSIVNQQWALHEGFKPCSTIKLVTGLAGLNENVIDATDTTNISDGNHVTLTSALAHSKNPYFQQVGQQVGFDKMVSYARRLGLGEKTGINVDKEYQGSVPGPASRLAPSRMWSHGDNFQVTPIQLATLVSAMANGGKLLTPRVARTRQESLSLKVKVRRQVKLDTNTWRNMVPGMVGSVSYGSGRRAFDPTETVVGKTGTCIDQGTWVGLFTSYAPLANPRLAVVVIAKGLDAHNHVPAAVAGQIYRDLNGRFGTPATLQLATTSSSRTSAGNPQTDTDDEEEDESSAVSKTWKEANNIGGIRPSRDTTPIPRAIGRGVENKVIPVLMPIPRRNPETAKPAGSSSGAPVNGPERDTRPRRVLSGL
jgi:membrane peptidoglycan carboxypeptidase